MASSKGGFLTSYLNRRSILCGFLSVLSTALVGTVFITLYALILSVRSQVGPSEPKNTNVTLSKIIIANNVSLDIHWKANMSISTVSHHRIKLTSKLLADAKQCQVKQLSCPRREMMNHTYFKAIDQCDTSLSLDTCLNDFPLDWRDLSVRKYYLVGNSVTRHYAFALRNLLLGNGQSVLSRKEEKSNCHGAQGPDFCCFNFVTRANIETSVKFFWKNYIGISRSHDDKARDICQDSHTEPCFKRLFKQASSRDVLILGSVPADTGYFEKIQGNSWAPLYVSAPQWVESQIQLQAEEVLELLLRTFPGIIMWHSYAFLNMEKNQHTVASRAFGDLNRCFAYGNSLIACAARAYPRIAYINLTRIQSRRVEEYNDLIHHNGNISDDIVHGMLGLLSSITNGSFHQSPHVLLVKPNESKSAQDALCG
jgi:hypothetical protein